MSTSNPPSYQAASSTSRFLTSTTSLAAKPPQTPISTSSSTSTSRTILVRSPSSSNYMEAQAESKARHLTSPTSAGSPIEVMSSPTAQGGQASSPTATCMPWSPGFDRAQSWSEQDMKRKMQERLFAEEKGKESGFSEVE